MIPDVYEVTAVGRGCLYVMPRPSSEWLKDDIIYFSTLEINTVISHLEKQEEREVGLSKEGALLNEAGIEFLSYPIKDRGLPEVDQYAVFIETIYQRLFAGENIAVHCRAGIGRTGLTASCLLVRDGYESLVAMDMVSAARGTQIPDTEEQYDFICDFLSK